MTTEESRMTVDEKKEVLRNMKYAYLARIITQEGTQIYFRVSDLAGFRVVLHETFAVLASPEPLFLNVLIEYDDIKSIKIDECD